MEFYVEQDVDICRKMNAQNNYIRGFVSQYKNLTVRLDDTMSYEHRLAVFIIFTIGVALRVYAWYAGEGYLYFSINDEVLAYRYALGFLAGETHTYYLAQPAFASGQAPGPLWTLFCVMLLKLGHGSMHYALLWMALFNSIAIYLVYRLARHFFAPNLALFAMTYFALAPWAIYYSTGLYNPLPLVVIGGILFLSLWNVLNHDHSPQIFWVCLLSAAVPQFHMIGVFYLPVIAFLLVISPHSINKKWFVSGILAGLVLYFPYLVGEWQHDFANTRNMLTGTDDHSYGVVKILTAPITMISSIPAGWAGRDFASTIAYANSWFGSIYVLLFLCLLSLLFALVAYVIFFKKTIHLLKQYWKNPRAAYLRQPKLVFMATLIIFPLILFAFTRHGYATRYTILILPLLFLLPSLFFKSIHNILYKQLFYSSGAIILLLNMYLVITFFQHQGLAINHLSKFSPSFKAMESLANEINHRVGQDKHVKIILSRNIQELPEGERKVAIAFTEYFDLINRYSHTPDQESHVTLEMKINDSLEDKVNEKNVLYRTNSVSFIVLPP